MFLNNEKLFALILAILEDTITIVGSISRAAYLSSIITDLEELKSLLDETNPRYILCKTTGGGIVLIYYMPEGASTREKTKYASMLATLHQGISGIIGKNIDSVFVNSKEEIYDALIEKKTEEKQRTKDVRACEGGCSRGSRKGHPLSLKVSEAARASVEKLSGGEAAFNFVQLEKANDMSTETLNLEMTAFTEPDDIQHVLSSASPRYSIYSWTHLYNDSMVTSNIFIYTCPKASTIKERMLYSSMCLSALSVIEQWIRIDKKIETDDLIDINKTMLYSILHPSVEKKDKLFLKPKRPGK